MKKMGMPTKKVYIVSAICAIVVLAIIGWFLTRKHQVPSSTNSSDVTANTESTSSIPSSATPSTTSDKTQSAGSPVTSTPTTSSTPNLPKPTGTFVSNHRPNLSGQPAPNSMNSICITIEGASCQIAFIKDGISKALPSKVADKNGTVTWDWKLQDIGLEQGTWQIQAQATLGAQKQVSIDNLNLEVGP